MAAGCSASWRRRGRRLRRKELNMSSAMYRRRHLAMTAADDASRWASLHADLVRLIGWRVLAGDLLDYVRFRAVCPLWRSSTVCPRGRGLVDARFHPWRWMLLPEGRRLYPGHSKLHGYVRFFNLSTGFFVRAWLPLFKDHHILDSVDGLILLLREQDSTVRLFHPFTGDIAELPPLTTLMRDLGANLNLSYLRDINATTVSVSVDGVITVMIVLGSERCVAFATSGRDHQWCVSTGRFPPIWWSLSFKGSLYILQHFNYNSDAQIFQIDLPQHRETGFGLSSLSPPKLIATCPGKIQPLHLVECDSDILVIGCSDRPDSLDMLVYRLADLILDEFVPVAREAFSLPIPLGV